MEMVLFWTIGSMVLVIMIGLLSRGGKILELGRRTSGSQGDLKILVETMTEDAAELLCLTGSGQSFDSAVAATSFSFVVRSSRAEFDGPPSPIGILGLIQIDQSSTVPMAGGGGLRRVEYRLDGTGPLVDCIRTVTPLTNTLTPSAAAVTRTIVQKGIQRLQIWPVAAVLQGTSYRLTMATDPAAANPGSTVACLLVDVTAGQQGPGNSDLDTSPITALVTKLWCRNRIMEIPRGVLR